MKKIPVEPLPVSQLVKATPTLYTPTFNAVCTTARRARWIQSTPSNGVSLRCILIFTFHLRLSLSSGSVLQFFQENCLMHFCCTPSVLHAPPIFVQCRVLIAGAVLLWVLTCRTYSTLQLIDYHHHHHRHHVSTRCHALPSLPRPTNKHTFCDSVAVGKQLKAVAFNIFNLWFKFMSLGISVRRAAHNALGDQHSVAGSRRCECLYSCSVLAANIHDMHYHAVFINWYEMWLHVSAIFGLYPVIADLQRLLDFILYSD